VVIRSCGVSANATVIPFVTNHDLPRTWKTLNPAARRSRHNSRASQGYGFDKDGRYYYAEVERLVLKFGNIRMGLLNDQPKNALFGAEMNLLFIDAMDKREIGWTSTVAGIEKESACGFIAPAFFKRSGYDIQMQNRR